MMKRRLAPVLSSILVVMAPGTVAAKDVSPMEARDLHRLRSVNEVSLSPDGRRILYVELDRSGSGRPAPRLLVYDRTTGANRLFRKSGKSGFHARWSPDGSRVALLGNHEGGYGLVVTDADGGHERLLAPVLGTNHPLPSSGERISWAPDGKAIAFVSAEDGPESDDAVGDPVVIRRYLYKPTASEGSTRFNDNRRVHVFLAELDSGSVRKLTDGNFYEHSVSFSPKGDEVLFVSNRESDPDRFFNYDIFAVRVRDGAVRRITRTENAEYRPEWSPDGSSIAYQGTTRGLTSSETTMEDTHIWVMSSDGTKRRELVTLDNRQSAPRWTADGGAVVFAVQQNGSTALYRASIGDGRPERILDDTGRVGSWSLGGDGTLAYAFHGPHDLAQLFLLAPGKKPEKLTSSNEDLLSRRELAETVSLDYRSFDGTAVEAFLTLPLGRGSGTKHPLITMLKGGPHTESGPELNHKAQVYAGFGWATLQVNYRGSTGYGQAFADAIFADQNGGEAKDVLYGVQAALRRYDFLDERRLGIEGVSYGGQLTNWLVTQTNIFKAAVPIAGISNLISFNYMAYYHDYLAVEYGAFPHQDDLMDRLWDRSPLKHVARVETPVLFVHGENDNDVPIAEAEQFYIALRDVGVETVMARYPREGHGIRETEHAVDVIERSAAWYRQHFDSGHP